MSQNKVDAPENVCRAGLGRLVDFLRALRVSVVKSTVLRRPRIRGAPSFGVAPTAESIGRVMTLDFFTIPALYPQPAQEKMNRYCAGQRVVSIERQFVGAGSIPFGLSASVWPPAPGPCPTRSNRPRPAVAPGGKPAAIGWTTKKS